MRKKPNNGSVDVEKLKIPLHDLKNISDPDRYSYYLLGHMFNELMCLQKLIYFTMPRHGDIRDIRRGPEMAQAVFLFRIALSKISEARKELGENKALKSTFKNLILPKWPEGVKRQADLNAALDAATWLSKLRNKVGFHFPNFNQLEPYVQPTDEWTDDYIYMSSESGNVFYDAANVVVLHWMFSLYGSEKVADAIEPMVIEMIHLIKLMTSYLEDAVGVLISESILADHNARVPGGAVIAPKFSDVQVPFWTHLPRRGDSD